MAFCRYGFHEFEVWGGLTVPRRVNEITFTRAVWHFESKELVSKICLDITEKTVGSLMSYTVRNQISWCCEQEGNYTC